MEITVTVKESREVTAIRITVPVNYGDEDMPTDFPGRRGDVWVVCVGIDDGVIRDWPKGFAYNLDMKVVDAGVYTLLDEDGDEVAERGDYVPDFFPGNHYGDYIRFNIDGDGKIEGWSASPAAVAAAFFPDDD
jgi:hypothetical protein